MLESTYSKPITKINNAEDYEKTNEQIKCCDDYLHVVLYVLWI